MRIIFTNCIDTDAEVTRKRPRHPSEAEPLFLPDSSDDIIDLDDVAHDEKPEEEEGLAPDGDDPSYGWYEKDESNEAEVPPLDLDDQGVRSPLPCLVID